MAEGQTYLDLVATLDGDWANFLFGVECREEEICDVLELRHYMKPEPGVDASLSTRRSHCFGELMPCALNMICTATGDLEHRRQGGRDSAHREVSTTI